MQPMDDVGAHEPGASETPSAATDSLADEAEKEPKSNAPDAPERPETPMIIYPALDLLNGRAVRITRETDGQMTVADDDPIAVARRWQAAGAEWLHMVDLDGAREGGARHVETLRAIAEATGLRIQFGGGVRTEDDVAAALAAGAARVVLATSAVRDADADGEATLAACLARWGERIAVSVDAHDGQITVGGWLPWATGRATDFAQAMTQLGVRTLVVANVSDNGEPTPGIEGVYTLLAELRAALPGAALIATGGVATLDDLRRLARLGVAGVVIGRALYDGALDLADALAAAANPGAPEVTATVATADAGPEDISAADTVSTPAVTAGAPAVESADDAATGEPAIAATTGALATTDAADEAPHADAVDAANEHALHVASAAVTPDEPDGLLQTKPDAHAD